MHDFQRDWKRANNQNNIVFFILDLICMYFIFIEYLDKFNVWSVLTDLL